jgi:hypothetical protein
MNEERIAKSQKPKAKSQEPKTELATPELVPR